jgi:hypothetical protein
MQEAVEVGLFQVLLGLVVLVEVVLVMDQLQQLLELRTREAVAVVAQ